MNMEELEKNGGEEMLQMITKPNVFIDGDDKVVFIILDEDI
jgi:hypothetical protein